MNSPSLKKERVGLGRRMPRSNARVGEGIESDRPKQVETNLDHAQLHYELKELNKYLNTLYVAKDHLDGMNQNSPEVRSANKRDNPRGKKLGSLTKSF